MIVEEISMNSIRLGHRRRDETDHSGGNITSADQKIAAVALSSRKPDEQADKEIVKAGSQKESVSPPNRLTFAQLLKPRSVSSDPAPFSVESRR